jgi:ABC-2 type transport system ATP-binding protein/lipopolysaccharide transport system ATP-binding protein
MPAVIQVEHVSKRYMLGEGQIGASLREAITGSLRRFGKRRGGTRQQIWSLRDVSFELDEGEALGVIGRNGAGKSTLLKILSRITEPTRGIARTRGRVAALLEVGTGFHPELTGRENVYLNGAILGLRRKDIDRRFDEIAAFSGVERFLDTPIKRYSTGMFLRLAFAVAAHLEPEILVVDEVLAVGDVEFQAKCLGRMSHVGREGRTVVFVSHNLDAIAQLCGRCMWLEKGEIAAIGPTPEVIDQYLATQKLWADSAEYAQDALGRVTLDTVLVRDTAGRPTTTLQRDCELMVEVQFTVHTRVPGLDLAAQITNLRGVEVLNEAWSDTVQQRPTDPGMYRAQLRIPPILNVGDYALGVWLGTTFDTFVHDTSATHFHLEGGVDGRPRRVIELGLPWQVERIDGVTLNAGSVQTPRAAT